MRGGDDEDYGAGEVLTGAELYLYLLRQNEEQLQRAQEKLREYTALQDTLQHLTERSRRKVLAPVAGGLAYYAAELNATNTILVLLGDGWFAERSATQACEIAGRRVDFLRREAEVLQQEQTTLRARQELFLSELPEAQQAVTELMAAQAARATAAVSSSASAVPRAAPASSGSSAPVAASVSAPPCEPPTPSPASPQRADPAATTPAPAEAGAPLDLASIDAALATFDELDELTEDELIALEAELGDRVNDDAYVEQVMTERMIAKKEARIRAELAKRSTAAAPASTVSGPTSEQPAAATPRMPAEVVIVTPAPANVAVRREDAMPTEAPRPALLFRTPGEIGGSLASLPSSTAASNEAQSAVHATPDAALHGTGPATSTPTTCGEAPSAAHPSAETGDASTASSPSSADSPLPRRKERHVHFAASVPGEPPTAVHVDAATAMHSAVATSSALPPSTSLLRSTYTVGDIVEHHEATTTGTAAAATLPAMPPPLVANTAQKPKRRSLFMRELEGDGA